MSKPVLGDMVGSLDSGSGDDQSALWELTPTIYNELRRLAAAYLRRERRDHTLQPTALVHEAYLRLVGQAQVPSHNRAQFFAIAAHLMRQILVNHAKRHGAAKRGSGKRVALDQTVGQIDCPQVDLLALNEALEKLVQLDARQSQIVELRFFGGLTEDEIADVLNLSPITVKRNWRIARAFLHNQLGRGRAL